MGGGGWGGGAQAKSPSWDVKSLVKPVRKICLLLVLPNLTYLHSTGFPCDIKIISGTQIRP